MDDYRLILLVVLTSLTSQTQGSICKSAGSKFFSPRAYKEKCYYLSTFSPRNYDEANTYCDKLGGYLAELDDWDELRFAQNVVLTSDCDIVYIAGSDRAQEGRWIFPRTGQPIRVFDWKTREPNNLGNVENCLHLWKSYDAKMNDYVCEFTKQKSYFLCEV
ncbi:perlucin-like protein [Biomphalaria pfeifferi]|uniref:Perlucin-like protein n=1 Tax=Biomphalaria pfeifferi TaxID=112525 RepID=A0AAD8FL61_BIOPF|nr:perlucin-like protein [Biomphalaria pfeifferi]